VDFPAVFLRNELNGPYGFKKFSKSLVLKNLTLNETFILFSEKVKKGYNLILPITVDKILLEKSSTNKLAQLVQIQESFRHQLV
jgi:hypothetical protein